MKHAHKLEMNALVAAMTVTGLACGADDPMMETDQQRLLGAVNTNSNCSADHVDFQNDIMLYGRVAAASPAFAECIDEAIRTGVGSATGPYVPCAGDPFGSDPLSTQIERVLDITHSDNDVSVSCSGASNGANASAWLGTYGHESNEAFAWGPWFDSVMVQLSQPLCAPGESPPICRFAPYPWPYSQAAGIVWHEVMHTHGYTHGADTQAPAKTACGQPASSSSSWNFQNNTMPYIVGKCISAVINRSANQCGNLETCSPHELRMIDGFDSTSCECLRDPGFVSVALVERAGGEMRDYATLGNGEWMGGWHFGDSDQIVATGDFNADGRDDFIIRSQWGFGLVRQTAPGDFTSLNIQAFGSSIGGWQFGSGDSIEGVGDFNGDGRDDFVIRNNSGIGIFYRTNSGALSLLNQYNYGTRLGGWRLGTQDKFEGIGDFNDDGRDDLLVQSSWGLGVLYRTSSGTFRSLNTYKYGTWLGGWHLGTQDKIEGIGDFNGDGRDDFAVSSAWGLGLIYRQSSGALRSLNAHSYGTMLGGWRLGTQDRFRGVGDFNGDGRADLIVTSPWGLGILYRTTTGSLRALNTLASGGWIGGWHFGASDDIEGVGDFNGDGRDDFVIRSGWGLGIVYQTTSGSLDDVNTYEHGDLLGSWLLKGSDRVLPVLDANSNGQADLFLQR